MNLEYEITDEDYVKFNMFHFENLRTQKRLVSIFQYGFPSLILILFALGRNFDVSLLLANLIVVFLWVWLFPKLHRKLLLMGVKRLIKEGQGREFIGWRKLVFKDDVIYSEMENKKSEINYKGVEKIVETKDTFYVYVGSLMAHIVPFRVFKDEKEKQEFVDLLKQKCGK